MAGDHLSPSFISCIVFPDLDYIKILLNKSDQIGKGLVKKIIIIDDLQVDRRILALIPPPAIITVTDYLHQFELQRITDKNMVEEASVEEQNADHMKFSKAFLL